ncbi:MAG: response regulator transcription factor [Oscillospiraceae bacterium]|nr:response regulator transcription factor [Oscillospiraceae bacterium]
MIRILIAEDEQAISDLIAMSLTQAGYTCVQAMDGLSAADRLEEQTFDLALLDIMLPGCDGYELLDYIRPLGIPVIFITAKGSVADRVKGLRLGADDYLVKPFELVELVARVESVLRRYQKGITHFSLYGVEVDALSRRAVKDGQDIPLTRKEFDLLLLFLQNKNVALFRETLYERVWGEEYTGEGRTVDLHVQRLRKKLGWEDKIAAVYKVGYRLEVSE